MNVHACQVCLVLLTEFLFESSQMKLFPDQFQFSRDESIEDIFFVIIVTSSKKLTFYSILRDKVTAGSKTRTFTCLMLTCSIKNQFFSMRKKIFSHALGMRDL